MATHLSDLTDVTCCSIQRGKVRGYGSVVHGLLHYSALIARCVRGLEKSGLVLCSFAGRATVRSSAMDSIPGR